MRKTFILFAVLILSSCTKSDPDREILHENLYETLFMELAVLNQMDERLFSEFSKDDLKTRIYEHYGVSEERFRISHEYYESQIDLQMERVEKLSNLLREERDSINTLQRELKRLEQEHGTGEEPDPEEEIDVEQIQE